MADKRVQILLIEDNPGDAKLIQEMLKKAAGERFDVVRVDRLSTGLKHLTEKQPDVILLGLGLPDSQGLDALTKLYNLGSKIPIVVLTGWDDKSVSLDSIRQGAQDYLIKGKINGSALWRVVNYAIERKKLVQELRESEQHYHELVEEGNDGIIIIQDGNIVFANPQIMKTTGYSLEQTLGKPFVGFVVPESRNLVIDKLKMRMSGERASNKFDIEINDINGKKIPVEIGTSVIKYHGRTAKMAIIRDITERKLAEATLRQSENKYRELTESISDVFFAMDNELRYTHWNKASEKLTGITATDVLGKKFFDIFPENEVTRSLQQIYLKAIRTQQSQHFISEYPGSQNIIHEITVYPSKDGISVFIKDITERRQLEKKANYLASFPELNPNPILELDQEGNLKYQNPAMKSIFPDFTTVGVNNPFLADWVQVVKELQDTNWSKEINRETKVGSEYYEQVISPVSKNQIRIYARKITERKQAENAVRESEEKYRLIVENSRDVIFTLDAAGKILYMSPSIINELGYSPAELIGKPIWSLVHPEDIAAVTNKVQLNVAYGLQNRDGIEYRFRHASGEWRWYLGTGTTVVDANGNFLNFTGIARDITERKKAEAEKKQLEEKAQVNSRLAAIGEMAAGIAHEINNPLTSILGFSQIVLEKEDVPEDIKENLKFIVEGSQRVAEIVRRLLVFARQAKPLKTSVNINEILENTLKLREYVLKTNNIEVITMFDPELPWISVDPSQMQQVFLNLIVNAEQAMKKAHGRGILTLTTEKRLNNIRLSVQDDGPGISKENMRHLFEPFFTTKDPGEGTGLGLSLSRSIILEHNGEISVESESGNGATFIIELPIMESPPPEIETTSRPTQTQSFTKRNGRILVIDDEPTIRELLEKALTRVGHSVNVIGDATTAVEIIDAGTIYDVIITDVRMPGMNGLELYALAVRKMPAMKHRIIFITGDVMGADIKAFISNNNIPFLAKPFRMNELEEMIGNILGAEKI